MTTPLEEINPAAFLLILNASSATDQNMDMITATIWDKRMFLDLNHTQDSKAERWKNLGPRPVVNGRALTSANNPYWLPLGYTL